MNKSNLAQKHDSPQGEVVRFPKQERVAMANKQEGYTRTPNYLVDNDYVAEMSGNTLKCYVVLNRFTEGFSRQNWAMDSKFLLKKTGIKKPHTLFESLKYLEEKGLIFVERIDGKPSQFSISNPCQETALVDNTHAEKGHNTHAEKGHNTHAEKGHNTHAEKGHTKKESKKENIENDEEDARESFQPQNRMLNFVMYHTDDQKFYKLVELTQTYPVESDFIAQAQVSFPNMSLDRISAEFKKLCQWSLAANKNNPQKWMTTWLNWLSNTTEKPQTQKQQPAPKSNSRNVNEAWGDPQNYAPASDIDTGDYL